MSSTSDQQERTYRRLVSANILTKLAMYFLAFGLLMLCTGGIRSFFFPSTVSAKVLIIIGTITALVGVIFTIVAILVMRSLSPEISPDVVWSLRRPSRRDIRREIQTISSRVSQPHPVQSSSSSSNNFSYSNPALVAPVDDKCWEPPPSYEDATKAEVLFLSVDVPPPNFPCQSSSNQSRDDDRNNV